MNTKITKILLAFVLLSTACGRDRIPEYKGLTGLEGGKKFAVPTGTVADQFVLGRFPDANIVYYNTVLDCAMAVKNGLADASVYDMPVLKNIAAKNPGLRVLEELLAPDSYGFAVQPDNHDLKNAIDRLLSQIKEDGTYQEMLDRWLPAQGEPGPLPEIHNPGTDGVLRFGTAAVTEPMSYYSANQQITGFDIEFALRIATALNKKLEVTDMEFGALLPSLISGKVDMVGAGLSITEERAKSVLFSEGYYDGGLVAIVAGGPAANEALPSPGIMTLEDIEDKKLGVLMGSIYDAYAQEHYPNASIYTFNTVTDMLTSLSTGKVDAAFVDQPGIREIFANTPGLAVLEEFLFSINIGAGFSKQDAALREQFNEFLQMIRDNGIYAEIEERWMHSENATMPSITPVKHNGTLRVGVVSDIGLPNTARSGDQLIGFDIELVTRFAAYIGKELVFTDLPFASLLPSLVSKRIDMITACMTITEERQKQIDFSDPYLTSGASVIISENSIQTMKQGALTHLEDISDKRVGIFTGTVHDAFMAANYPEARVFRFENTADLILSLKTSRIDVAMLDRITAGIILKRNNDLGLLSDEVFETPLGVGFNKNNPALLAEFNQYLEGIRKDGTYDEMHERWLVSDAEEAQMPSIEIPTSGKKLVAGVSVEDLPYVAYMNGQYVGFDIEMIQRFAQRHNYQLEIVVIEFPALVAALASGKVDLITDGISISEERARQINFSDPYAMFRTAVIARKADLSNAVHEIRELDNEPFFKKLANSFHSNIIHEKRYLLILRGLYVTVLITVLAAILGTMIGGLFCLMRMSQHPAANKTARWLISLIRGTPVLVFLMITYYIIFASVNINPVLVAVIAFGINFAAYVSEMFRTAIESIDHGQQEAGIASGFTRIQTFIHIIAPQALHRVLPVYKGEFISLLKMTSIVGYIAVQDLTKASDIIRSRTFDAFFPLIMAAVIYIVLAWLLTLVLDRIQISADPMKRRIKLMREAKQ